MRLDHLSAVWLERLLVCSGIVIFFLNSHHLFISFMSQSFNRLLFCILVVSFGRSSIYSKQLLLEFFLFSMFLLLLKLYCGIIERRACDTCMVEPFPGFLVRLLYAVHWTGDASQLTLLPHGCINVMSFERGTGCQRQVRFGRLLLVMVRCGVLLV